jgi:hypothetical protein
MAEQQFWQRMIAALNDGGEVAVIANVPRGTPLARHGDEGGSSS